MAKFFFCETLYALVDESQGHLFTAMRMQVIDESILSYLILSGLDPPKLVCTVQPRRVLENGNCFADIAIVNWKC